MFRTKRSLALVFMFSSGLVASAAQSFGAEFGFLSVPLARADPYSYAASGGIWGEFKPFRAPLVLGAWAAAAGFRSMSGDFGDSRMYYGGLDFGYDIGLFSSEETSVSIRPTLRLGWYYRSVDFLGVTEWGSRPFGSAGAIVRLRTGTLDIGLAALVSVPFDRGAVLLYGVQQRIGMAL